MKSIKIFHICCESPVVVFRSEKDYMMAVNRLATSAYVCGVEVLAFCIMSTHFHLIIRGEDIDDFVKMYRRTLCYRHKRSYVNSIKLPIYTRQLKGAEEVIIALDYVIKNPIHHGIANSIFPHPYSSANCYFHEELRAEKFYSSQKEQIKRAKKPSELGGRLYRELFGGRDVPDSFEVMDDVVVLPESFVKYEYVQTLYSTVKNFLFHMNKPLKEEKEMFGGDVGSRNQHLNKLDLVGVVTDIQLCEFVDTYIYPRTYPFISEMEKIELWNNLKGVGVSWSQFLRVVGDYV